MSILLPLYVYPWAGAWDPLFAAFVHRSLEFPSKIAHPLPVQENTHM